VTTLLFDRGLGAALPRTLRQLGVEAEAHGDHFADGTPDEEWLAAAAARGWAIVTGDRRVASVPAARERVRLAGVGCFVLAPGGRTRLEQVATLSRAWARMQEVAGRTPGPFVCAVRADGSVEGAAPPPRRARLAIGERRRPRVSRLQPMLPGMEVVTAVE
jgi:hypothetical protein